MDTQQHRIQRPGGERGARNMKSMWPPIAAIFFVTYFYRVGGSMAPSTPPDPLLTQRDRTSETPQNYIAHSKLFYTTHSSKIKSSKLNDTVHSKPVHENRSIRECLLRNVMSNKSIYGSILRAHLLLCKQKCLADGLWVLIIGWLTLSTQFISSSKEFTQLHHKQQSRLVRFGRVRGNECLTFRIVLQWHFRVSESIDKSHRQMTSKWLPVQEP